MAIYKLTNTSDGNQIYVTDLSRMAQNTMDITRILPTKQSTPMLCGGWYFSDGLKTDTGGACIVGDKLFTTESTGYILVEKGQYLYAEAAVATIEPRISSAGQPYNQYIKYSLFASSTELSHSTDYYAELGTWEIINGAATEAMTDEEYEASIINLLKIWNSYNAITQSPGYINDSTYFAANVVNTNAIAPASVTPSKLSLNTFGALNIVSIGTFKSTYTAEDYGCIYRYAPYMTENVTITLNAPIMPDDSDGFAYMAFIVIPAGDNPLIFNINTPNNTINVALIAAIPFSHIRIDIHADRLGNMYVFSSYCGLGIS